jgi:hypothetical protein
MNYSVFKRMVTYPCSKLSYKMHTHTVIFDLYISDFKMADDGEAAAVGNVEEPLDLIR